MDVQIEQSGSGRTGRNEQRVSRAQLTERDKQLMGYLGLCRYLSSEQVLRLFFPGRDKASSLRRLLRLAGEWRRTKRGPNTSLTLRYSNFEPPYLRRVFFRTYDGERVEVWTLTEFGYAVAGKVLGGPVRLPQQDVGPQFLEHTIVLNELLVELVDPAALPCSACGGKREWAKLPNLRGGGKTEQEHRLVCVSPKCRKMIREELPSPAELPFRWVSSEGTRLPWQEYDRLSGSKRDRVIVPDCVVELPVTKQRLFVECETGSHTVVPKTDQKPGATIAKLNRYKQFIHGYGPGLRDATNYARTYPDGWGPVLLFLVGTEGRRNLVNAALEAETQKGGWQIAAKAVTREELVALISGAGRQVVAPTVPPRQAEEVLLPGRLSVRATFLVEANAWLRRLMKEVEDRNERLRRLNVSHSSVPVDPALLKTAEVYAERAAAALKSKR